jgi:hypothetical protein
MGKNRERLEQEQAKAFENAGYGVEPLDIPLNVGQTTKTSGGKARKSKKASDDKAPKPKKKWKVKEAIDWQRELGVLLDLGRVLDAESIDERYWKEIRETGIYWKPKRRDQWIEEYLRIRTKEGNNGKFELNPVQRGYSARCGKQNIVLKARQVGMTSYIAARLFVETVTHKGTLTMLVAHDQRAAQEIFRIVHRFWNHLPEKWQQGPLKTSHSSMRELVFPRLDSEFMVTSADENAGRGRTIQNLHCTEVSRWGPGGDDALAALRAALVPGGQIVLESTANGALGSFYQEWQRAEETGYTRHFFPWWFEERYKCQTGAIEMTLEEAELANEHGLTAEQIAWRRQQWSTLRGMAAQEYAEDAVSCFRASGECVFELDVIDIALGTTCLPIETRDNRRLSIWLPPQTGKQYVIGVDPAGGGSTGDYSCAEVIERTGGSQCAELVGHFTMRELSRKVVELAKAYNSALLVVERNNHGHGVLTHLRNLEYPNIFVEKAQDGWNTTGASRPAMIENMADVLADSPELFRSERLWNECRTFIRNGDGTARAASGAHDDCVMAMGIALAVRRSTAGMR